MLSPFIPRGWVQYGISVTIWRDWQSALTLLFGNIGSKRLGMNHTISGSVFYFILSLNNLEKICRFCCFIPLSIQILPSSNRVVHCEGLPPDCLQIPGRRKITLTEKFKYSFF